ncbi:hypothetical protein QFZ76_009147 [Streptomyces sp. V4I2]|nr:hypothetical protein [Streptomyces sp. V4I2]
MGVPDGHRAEQLLRCVRRGRHPAGDLPRGALRDRAEVRRQGRRADHRRGRPPDRSRVQGAVVRHEGGPAGRLRGDGLRHREVRSVDPDQPRFADPALLRHLRPVRRGRAGRRARRVRAAEHLPALPLPEGGVLPDPGHLHRRTRAAGPDAQAGVHGRREAHGPPGGADRLQLQPRRGRDLPVPGHPLHRAGHGHPPLRRTATRPARRHVADVQGSGGRRGRRLHRAHRDLVDGRLRPRRGHHARLRHRQVHVGVPGPGQLLRQRGRHPLRRPLGERPRPDAGARRVLSGEIREDALAPVEEAPAPDADATARRKQAAPPDGAAEPTVVVDEPPAAAEVPAARPAEDDEAVPANHR